MSTINKVVQVPYPLNLAEEERFWYEPYLTYEQYPQKIKYLHKVFVGNSGLCLTNKGLIKECHHSYLGQYRYYQNEAAKFYFDVQDNPEKLITLDDDQVYLLIHHPWFNYYHWVCEALFRLWMVRNKLDDMILLLPAYYRNADFITGSIEPFNIKRIFYIPDECSVIVRNLCLPQIKPICDSYNVKQLRQLSSFYRSYVQNIKHISTDLGDRIYVSRKLASRRKVVNEDEIIPVFEKFGFTIFNPERFCFQEQVSIFSKTKFLVGEHGSGLTNLLFMTKGTSLLELHKSQTNELSHPSPLFWYMAQGIGVNYYHQLCTTYGRKDYFDGHYIVDPAALEQNLLLMCNS